MFQTNITLASYVQVLDIEGYALPAEIEDLDDREEIEVEDRRDVGGRDDGEGTVAWGINYVSLDFRTLRAMVQLLPHLKHLALGNIVFRPTPSISWDEPIPLESLSLDRTGMLNAGDIMNVFHVLSPKEVFFNVFWRPDAEGWLPVLVRGQRGLTATKWVIRAEPDVSLILFALLHTPFYSHAKSLDVPIQDEEELRALMQLLQGLGSGLECLKLDLAYGLWGRGVDAHMDRDRAQKSYLILSHQLTRG